MVETDYYYYYTIRRSSTDRKRRAEGEREAKAGQCWMTSDRPQREQKTTLCVRGRLVINDFCAFSSISFIIRKHTTTTTTTSTHTHDDDSLSSNEMMIHPSSEFPTLMSSQRKRPSILPIASVSEPLFHHNECPYLSVTNSFPSIG